MKKMTLSLVFILSAIVLLAQTPQAFSYQAVVRDNGGTILQNQNVGVRISIHDATAGGTIIYQETFSETTNQFGLVNLEIGMGKPTIGTFPGIDWGNNSKFIETEIDTSGGTVYVKMGTSQLLSVPYALFAQNSGSWITSGNNIYSSNTGNVGIGLANPSKKLEVSGDISIPPMVGGRLKIGRSGLNGDDMFSIIEATGPNSYSGGLLFRVWDGSKLQNRMVIDNQGEVGIGTTSPLSKLHVIGDNGTAVYAVSDVAYAIEGVTDGALHAGVVGRSLNNGSYGIHALNQTFGGTALKASSLGGLAGHFEGNIYCEVNVGIGTAYPLQSSFHIVKSGYYDALMRIENSSTDGADVFMGSTNSTWACGGNKFILGHGTPSATNIRLTIDNGGKVGIGTYNPQHRLEVNGTTLIGTGSKGIIFRNTGQLVDIESVGTGLAINYQSGENTVMNVVSGKVGIGTSNPTYQLDVVGTGYEGGVIGKSDNSVGVAGISDTHFGIYGKSSSYYAGWFFGDVNIIGSLSKGGGSFVIDHPLDPENKILRHNFVESPENLLIYRGKVQLDATGQAYVEMPDYFKALTSEDEASIHLTPVGKPFMTGAEWNNDYSAIIIYGDNNREVFWEVLAERDDPVIHEIGKPVEEEKGADNKLCERGKLLYPKAYGYPESMGRDYEFRIED